MSNKKNTSNATYRNIGNTCTVFNLRKATRTMTTLYEDLMRPSGLRVTQFSLLVATQNLGPVTISTLAEAMVMDRTTLTRNLKPLEREGFLVTTLGTDQRSREVSLTDKGLIKLNEALPMWEQAQETVINKIGKNQLTSIINDLNSLVKIGN